MDLLDWSWSVKSKYSRYDYFDNIEEIGKPLKKLERR
jgi:hypothetical protein